jgi:hypothetical protein
MVVDHDADEFRLTKHQAEMIQQALEAYDVSSVINGVKPMCKFSNKNKWYKLGDTFYVSKENLPVTFSKVLSNPTRVLLMSGNVQIIKKVIKK